MAGEQKGNRPESATVSYLLRVWRVQGVEGIVLRAALKLHHNGEWVGFASLEALVAALRAEMEMGDEADAPPQAANGAGRLASNL